MKKWTKENAINEIRILIAEINSLKSVKRMSTDHTKWVMKVLQLLEDVFGNNSRYYLSVADISWYETGTTLIPMSLDPQEEIDQVHQRAYLRNLDSARGMLEAALDYLEKFNIDEVYEGKNTRKEASEILQIIGLAEKQLRKIFREKPQNEKEVQNAFESLLLGAEIPYSREGESIEYSSKKYIPDFSFKRMGLAVEIKLCNKEGREKELIAEINDDIVAYKTKYPNLIFIVYDLGYIRDIDRFTRQIESANDIVIKVVKH